MKKKLRDIKKIALVWDTDKDLESLKVDETFKTFIIGEAYSSIKDALKNKHTSAKFLNVYNHSVLIEIEKKDFKIILDNIKNLHLEKQEFEECLEIQKLESKYKLL